MLRNLPKVTQLVREAAGIKTQIWYQVVLHSSIFCYLIFSAIMEERKHSYYPQGLPLRDQEQRPIEVN